MLAMFKPKEFLSRYHFLILFILAFLIWIFAFRHFIFTPSRLINDAGSYYEQITNYLYNLSHGIYPLWNPPFEYGNPNEFFLRRIGSFNPFLFLILFLDRLGIPHFLSYNLFLVSYYFLGMVGFYLLAKNIFGQRGTAFVAFLILLFSALGTRLFDSYFLFATIPIIWFFYFFCTFSLTPQRHWCLGIVFSLMIIMTTYIPFYFVTIFLSFLVCYTFFYGHTFASILRRYVDFITANKIFVTLCIVVLFISFLPGIFLFQEASQGTFALPFRHSTLTTQNVLEVDKRLIEWWAILEDLAFSSYFLRNLREYEFAIFYIPLFAFIIFLLGLATRITKRLAFFFVWALVGFLIGIPSTVVSQFLYNHIFYFKYLRNLHFFLWMMLLPIIALMLAEQWYNFLAFTTNSKRSKRFIYGLIIIVHVLLMTYFIKQEEIISSFIVIFFSLIFFLIYFCRSVNISERILLWSILGLIVIQPLEVYGYLFKNSAFEYGYLYADPKHFRFIYIIGEDLQEEIQKIIKFAGEYRFPAGWVGQKDIYYGLPWYSFLYANINGDVFYEYKRHKIRLYDRVLSLSDRDIDVRKIEQVFRTSPNIAFVTGDYQGPEFYGDPKKFAGKCQILRGDSEEFQMVRFTANEVKFKTNFKNAKFLVYNDNFDPKWKAYLDGQPTALYRANISFKGLWIPTGEHEVDLRYGETVSYVFNYLMLVLFVFVFIMLVTACYQAKSVKNKG